MMLKKLALIFALSPMSSMALEALHDESLGDVTGQEGVRLAIALTANWDNIYFDTDGNRFNLGNIDIDTDSRGVNGSSNEPFFIDMDTLNQDGRKGLALEISEVNSLNVTIRDVSLSSVAADGTESAREVYGTLGLENLSLNGESAYVDILGLAGVGEEGVMTTITLPTATFDFTINDFEDAAGNATDKAGANAPGGKGGEFRATMEINDFALSQTFDLVENPDGSTGMLLQMKAFHANVDITDIKAGNGARAGSYGLIAIDGMRLIEGSDNYLQINAVR